MSLPNKGITSAVKAEFINGTHTPEAMLEKLAHLNTDANRTAYLIHLTKELREKHNMETKRNKSSGKKRKTGAKKPTQLALDLRAKLHTNKTHTGFYGDGDLTAHEHSIGFEPQLIKDDVAEYVKLDDEYKVLMARYESLVFKYTDEKDKVEELKREVVRLQVIVSYLEGKK
jgi:hypothetical protein